MTGTPTNSISHNLQPLAQTMGPDRDQSQPFLDPRGYGTTPYNGILSQLGPYHPSHIPIQDTRPQPMFDTSELQFTAEYPYPQFVGLGSGTFPPLSGMEGHTAARLTVMENSFQGLQSTGDPFGPFDPIQYQVPVPPPHVQSKGALLGQTPNPNRASNPADVDRDSGLTAESELGPESKSEQRVALASQGTIRKQSRSQTHDSTPNKKGRSGPDSTLSQPARNRWKEVPTTSVHRHPKLMSFLEQRTTDPVYHFYHEIMGTSKNQSTTRVNWKTERDLPEDLKGLENKRLTDEQIKTLAFFNPTVRRNYEWAFRSRGIIRAQYAHLLETVENGRFKLPAYVLHSSPKIGGQPYTASFPSPDTLKDTATAELLRKLGRARRDRNIPYSSSQTLYAHLEVQRREATALDRIRHYDALQEDHPALQSQVKKWEPLPQPTPMPTIPFPKPDLESKHT
ncbi:unnamed protein product [Penicillium glandicola]